MRHGCAKALAVACALFVRGVKADLYEADGEYDEYDVDAYEDINQQYDDFGYGAAEYDAINEAGNSGLSDGLSYYGDEFDEYYDTYGAYGDEYGDDYSFASEERLLVDCLEDSAGKANVTGESRMGRPRYMSLMPTQVTFFSLLACAQGRSVT